MSPLRPSPGASEAAATFRDVVLETGQGPASGRHYAAPASRAGVVLVGGVGGGWDTPASGLYPRLCEELAGDGVASCLRVRFRHSTVLQEAVLDALAGLRFLLEEGAEAVAVAGHSFGGAVAIQAAALEPRAVACVTLATQSYGAAPAATLGPRCALLLLHGTEDEVLPAACSVDVHRRAQEPKALHLFPGAGHGLDEAAEEVHAEVARFLRERLAAPSGDT